MKKIFIILFLTIFCFQIKASEATDWIKELSQRVYKSHEIMLLKECSESQSCAFLLKNMKSNAATFYFTQWLNTYGFKDDAETLNMLPSFKKYEYAKAAKYKNIEVCFCVNQLKEGALVIIHVRKL